MSVRAGSRSNGQLLAWKLRYSARHRSCPFPRGAKLLIVSAKVQLRQTSTIDDDSTARGLQSLKAQTYQRIADQYI